MHSDPRVNQTGPSIPSTVNLSPFFILGRNQTACKEFSQLAFLGHVHNSFVDIHLFFHTDQLYSVPV
jgi:hypothetical protein